MHCVAASFPIPCCTFDGYEWQANFDRVGRGVWSDLGGMGTGFLDVVRGGMFRG